MLLIGTRLFLFNSFPAYAADLFPTLRGSIDLNCTEDVAVFGKYVYVADGLDGIAVIDASSVSSPKLVRTIPTTYAFRVYVHNDHLYLCDGPGGLKVYSLADQSSPTLTYSMDSLWAEGLEFVDPYVYLADYYAGVKVFLFEDPAISTLMVHNNIARARDIDIIGNSMIISDAVFGINVFDLKTPTDPIWTYNYILEYANYEDVVSHKGYSIVVRNDEETRLDVFWTYDPYNVQYIATLAPARFISGLTGNSNLLLASCGEDGVVAYDMTDPAVILPLWSVNTPNYARRAKAQGKFLYVADMAGLYIYEIDGLGGDWQ